MIAVVMKFKPCDTQGFLGLVWNLIDRMSGGDACKVSRFTYRRILGSEVRAAKLKISATKIDID